MAETRVITWNILGDLASFWSLHDSASGNQAPPQRTTRATYVIRAIYMTGHVEFISFDLDDYGFTEDQVLTRVQKRKLTRSEKHPGYGEIHSVRLVYSPKSPEHNADGYLLIACQQAPEHRPKVLIQKPSGRR